MTLENFIDLSVDDFYIITIWDCEKSENVFKGELYDIPTDLLGEEITSWELENGELTINIDTDN